jgi:hypothetical protein
MCVSAGRALWPLRLRPHYDLGPRLAQSLGTLPTAPALPWAHGAGGSLVAGPSDDAPVPGPEALAVAAGVAVAAWAAWAALVGCWSDGGSDDGAADGTAEAADAAAAAVAAAANAADAAAAAVRGQLAALCHWLAFWLPVCGVVQHGMVDSISAYLPARTGPISADEK